MAEKEAQEKRLEELGENSEEAKKILEEIEL
jgi:hypothetical protein